ncbi:MAG: iron-containing alcohol dehydrogenase, partial [Candidatus Firestonebacteria bacterium]
TERAPAVTIVDEDAVLEAPEELLIAGIGDSFAKYHEAKHVSAFKHVEKDNLAEIALFSSEKMYGIIRNKKAPKRALIYANIAMSGYVSTAGRNAASALFAHAFTNSVLVMKGAKQVLHGYLAALGVVFEYYMLNKKFPDTESYKRLGLPMMFKDLELNPTVLELEKMAELIKNDDSVEYFYPKIKPEKIMDGLKKILA